MPRSKRSLLSTVAQTSTPPSELPGNHKIARIIQATGNNLYSVELPSGGNILVEMPARFRSNIWVKRGSFVVIDQAALTNRDNKIGGEIVNVVRDEKLWRKQPFWPAGFVAKSPKHLGAEGDEESTVGKMPPDSDEEAS